MSPLWASVSPSKWNKEAFHSFGPQASGHGFLSSSPLPQPPLCRTGPGTQQTSVIWPALASPGSSCSSALGWGCREETGARELGAAPGPSSQDSQLHPHGGGGCPAGPAAHLQAARRLIPTDTEAALGVPRRDLQACPPAAAQTSPRELMSSPGR